MTDAVLQDAADLGLFARAVGAVTSPTATFRAVVANPRPAVILFLVAIVIALAVGLPQLTPHGQQTALDMMVRQQSRGQQMSVGALDRATKMAPYIGYLTMASTFIFLPIVSIIFTALYWAVFNTILGGTASFKQVLGIITHASVISALGAIAAAPILYFTDAPATMTGPFNLGALVPMLEPGSFVLGFLSSIGVFTLWQLVVTAIGLGVLYRKRSAGIAVALVSVYLAIVGTLAAVFPSFTAGSR